MKTRVISGIVIAVLAVVLLVLGGDVLFASLLLISLIGLYELYLSLIHIYLGLRE